jgi:hypothetical protein
LGFDVLALDSTTSSSSDIDAGFMAERRGDSGVSSSKLTAALGITWHDANWRTDRNHLPTADDTIIPKTASLPTRSQIDQLKVVELKQACLERGLPRVSDCARFGGSSLVCCLVDSVLYSCCLSHSLVFVVDWKQINLTRSSVEVVSGPT